MTTLLLALSLSLDSLGIGISYGLRRIKVSRGALAVILFMSAFVLGGSWSAGKLLLSLIPISTAKAMGSIFLIGLGLFIFSQSLLDTYLPAHTSKTFIIKSFNIVINIIRQPASGDLDHSGTIDMKEAIYVGIALSIDAMAIGIISGIYGINIFIFILLTMILNLFFLKIGEFLGRASRQLISEDKLKLISGSIIIFMGILKLV